MRPQKLEIEGLHSFLTRQTIDFSALSAGGLFGIFGNTGSGKSTILDAVILALYGSMPNEESRQFIHLRAPRAFVALEFLLAGKRYRAEREFRFNKRRDSVTAFAELSDLDTGSVLANQPKRVTELILELLGLSLDEFCKVVALQQGAFAEFLNSTRAQQTEIAGKLFSLEKYGDSLVSAANARQRARKAVVEELESQLAGYAADTEEALRAEEAALAEWSERESAAVREEYAAMEARQARQSAWQTTQKLIGLRAELGAARAAEAAEAESLRSAERKKAADALAKDWQIRQEGRQNLERAQAERDRAEKEDRLAQEEAVRERDRLAGIRERAERAASERERRREALSALAAVSEEQARTAKRLEEVRQEFRRTNERLQAAQRDLDLIVRQRAGISEEYEQTEARRKKLGARLSDVVSREFLDRLSGTFSGEMRQAETRFPGVEGEFVGTEALIRGARTEDGMMVSFLEAGERAGALARELADIQGREAAVRTSLAAVRADCERLTAEGTSLRAADDRYQQQRKDCGLRDFSEIGAEIARLQKESERDREEERTAQERSQRAEQRAATVREDLVRTRTEADHAAQRLAESEAVLSRKLADSFESEEEFLKALSFGHSAEEILAQSEQRRTEILRLEEQIRALSGEIAAEVSEREVAESSERERVAREEAQRIRRERAECVQRLDRLRLRLSEKKQREAQLRQAEHRYSVSLAVAEAVRGKALMKFAVEETLRDICRSASVILSGVTRGSYRLRYEGERGFCVSDNRNNGEIRDVATLSGGETFLVSLSLAVALSEAVSLAGTSRVEFFFLDEGFGSLDKALCDVVVDALETLKEDRFVIGLISHVETLKERLTQKLCVEFDEESGSRVSI